MVTYVPGPTLDIDKSLLFSVSGTFEYSQGGGDGDCQSYYYNGIVLHWKGGMIKGLWLTR